MGFVAGLHHTSVPMPPDGHDKARAFYGEVLGMDEVDPPSSLGELSVVWFRAGSDGQEVHVFVDRDYLRNSNEQHLCLQVNDIDDLRKHLAKTEVGVIETISITNRPRFFVRDPFNNLIELTQVTGDYD